MPELGTDFYDKYFPAYDVFRAAVTNTDGEIVSFEMFAAARVLSDTPMSVEFFEKVKAAATEDSDLTLTERREVLEELARDALTNCGLWHQSQTNG
ncbi:MAG: hypothetical protein AAGB32_01875 [Pseudomonadota bacterium]